MVMRLEGRRFISTLRMEAAWSSKSFVSNHHTTWCNNWENKFYMLSYSPQHWYQFTMLCQLVQELQK